MTNLINAYATVTNLPALRFTHELRGQRDLDDPELPDHLGGFQGFVMQGGQRQMTQTRYHVLRHIERVRHHVSFEVEESELAAVTSWAEAANALLFLTDGTVRDPQLRILVDPESGAPEAGAAVPYPADAHDRKRRTEDGLVQRGVNVARGLPPVVGAAELTLRLAGEVARRALALLAVAVRAESLAQGEPIPTAQLEERLAEGMRELTPVEREFLAKDSPERQDVVNFAWRYEALWVLQWALGLQAELPWPSAICDVPAVAATLLQRDGKALIAEARLRDAAEILDALDLHLRLHWAVREARRSKAAPDHQLEAGVISERHHALNWLVRFDESPWDEVQTPT
jgi:Domain of unknown function (DUF4272)